MIIDFHTHLFPADIRENREKYFADEPAFEMIYKAPGSNLAGASQIIDTMDEQQVDTSVIFGFPWQNPETFKKNNDYIIESVIKYPNRLIGFACFNISDKGIDRETERCLNAGLSGVGELALYTSGLTEEPIKFLEPVMEICRKNDVPLLLHTNEPVGHNYPGKAPITLTQIYAFIKRFPENKIVLAHWGGGIFFYTLMKKEVTETLKNVFFDTAASPFLYRPDIYDAAKKYAGIDKILFGSDFPLLKPERYFKELEQTELTGEDIENIKGINASKLLGRK
ncbi:MAG: amidohydrolase [Deltaproteobacteria bacterium]|nr:amidohydrolase [Deltaproteobacteria bacterium]